jgi:hypothetical protein
VAGVSALGQKRAAGQLTAEQAKERDARRLLNDMGLGTLGAQMMNQMFSTIRSSMPQRVPQQVWDELTAEFKAEFSAEKIVELNVPIYARY